MSKAADKEASAAVFFALGDEARQHIDQLSQRYLGQDYQAPIQSERVIVRIEPIRQLARGL